MVKSLKCDEKFERKVWFRIWDDNTIQKEFIGIDGRYNRFDWHHYLENPPVNCVLELVCKSPRHPSGAGDVMSPPNTAAIHDPAASRLFLKESLSSHHVITREQNHGE